jgi:hypothetical protein
MGKAWYGMEGGARQAVTGNPAVTTGKMESVSIRPVRPEEAVRTPTSQEEEIPTDAVSGPDNYLPLDVSKKLNTKPKVWAALTPPERQRIARLQLDEATFLFFRDEFVLHPWDYLRDSGAGWRQVKQHLTNDALLAHLEGGAAIATRIERGAESGELFRFFVIDLDTGEDLQLRYARVVDGLGRPSLLFETPSGGLHCFYFLGEPVPAPRLVLE